jgi:hypothetical protein
MLVACIWLYHCLPFWRIIPALRGSRLSIVVKFKALQSALKIHDSKGSHYEDMAKMETIEN